MLKEKSSVVINRSVNPARKNMSAIFSSLPLFLMEPLIDIEIEEDGWLDALPDAVDVVETGVTAALKAVNFTDQADVVVLLCDEFRC